MEAATVKTVVPPPLGRYQVRLRGVSVQGAHFDSVEKAWAFASLFYVTSQSVWDSQERREMPRPAPLVI